MNVGKEIDFREDLLFCCCRLAGEELLTNGRSKAYKMRIKEITELQEELYVLRRCLTKKDFPSVGEMLRRQMAAEAEGTP